jgi:hypothetical protein
MASCYAETGLNGSYIEGLNLNLVNPRRESENDRLLTKECEMMRCVEQ